MNFKSLINYHRTKMESKVSDYSTNLSASRSDYHHNSSGIWNIVYCSVSNFLDGGHTEIFDNKRNFSLESGEILGVSSWPLFSPSKLLDFCT